jgi:hypothetical protein
VSLAPPRLTSEPTNTPVGPFRRSG